MPQVIPLLKRILRLFPREDGSAMVEMAVSASIFCAMLFGICQVSYALYIYQYVSDAARQATRYAMVRGSTCSVNTPTQKDCGVGGITTDQITAYVKSLKFPGVKMSNVNVTPTWCAASSSTPTSWSTCSVSTSETPGNLVKVVVSYTLSIHIPFSTNFTGLTPTATSEMVIAQ